MNFKKESPARPPPPKVLGKRIDSSPSMKFSFKNLEQDEDDEEDLTILTGELTKKVESDKLKAENRQPDSPKQFLEHQKTKESDKTIPQVDKNRTESVENKRVVPSQRSWDSPTLVRQTAKSEPIPSRSASDNKLQKYSKSVEEEGSTFSWIKQNVAEISSVVKDKAEKAKKRIEEFSENIGKDDDLKVRDGRASLPEEAKSNKNDELTVRKEIVEQLKSVPMETNHKEISDSTDNGKEPLIEAKDMEELEEEEEFNIVEDFYTNEPQEDFSGLPSMARAEVFPKSKKTSLKRRFVKGKAPKLKTPVSMSKLPKDKVDELEELSNDFFDANDVSPNVSGTSKQNSELSTFNSLSENVEKHVPSKKFVGIIVCIFLYIIIPLPSYLSGMILGSFLASLGWISYIVITKPPTSKVHEKLIPVREMPPMVEPEIRDINLDDSVTLHKVL